MEKENEKLLEKVFEKKENLKKINQHIFFVEENKFDHLKLNKLFLELEKNYQFFSKKKILNKLRLICKI